MTTFEKRIALECLGALAVVAALVVGMVCL